MSSRATKSRKGATRRPNKAQQRASEVRAAQTVAPPPAAEHTSAPADGDAPVNEPVVTVVRRERITPRPNVNVRQRAGGPRVAARTTGLTRAQEYAAIRADLVRLLVTFGLLMVVMLVLLLVIDP